MLDTTRALFFAIMESSTVGIDAMVQRPKRQRVLMPVDTNTVDVENVDGQELSEYEIQVRKAII